jgi:hypothetical protein
MVIFAEKNGFEVWNGRFVRGLTGQHCFRTAPKILFPVPRLNLALITISYGAIGLKKYSLYLHI